MCIHTQTQANCSAQCYNMQQQQIQAQYQWTAAQQQAYYASLGATGAAMQNTYNTPDRDYEMFKQYAALEDGEAMRLFAEEYQSKKQIFDASLERIMATKEMALKECKEEFFAFCAKYKKSITQERFEKLKVFL